MTSERRLAFGQVARLYDEARPSYPVELVDDVLAYAGAEPGDAALEVGAGTGKATALFAARGLEIVALEPSQEMAQVARRNLGGFSDVFVTESEFERWSPVRAFKLVYSAQAWHWVEPSLRFARAAEALGGTGALAAFWNRVRWQASPLRDELDAVYRRFAPELGGGVGAGPMHPSAVNPADWRRDWQGDAEDSAGFTEPEWRVYDWLQPYTSRDYIGLLRTHSDHIVLDPSRREALLEAVAGVIDRAGGRLEVPYQTRLGLARPAG